MIQKPKGTYDVLDMQGRKILYLEELFRALLEKYNYEYVRTPLFEASELFHRSVGDSSDIVTKETYDFVDRGNRQMTLRPEGTAGVVRSFIENKVYGRASMPFKCWYTGSMYRYERPQSGRYREFYQMGVEAFGSKDPYLDAEIISIPVRFYQLLGLKGIKVHINSLGDKESRDNYRNALKEYFRPYLDTLCEDCKQRFDKNPLRILDCKIDRDLEIMKNAPQMKDYLNDESKAFFEQVKKGLEVFDISYVEDSSLVRGLDYYSHTVFEVEANVEGFGSQNVLCGGGRYDGLVEVLGGPSTPGVGFALGMERLLTALEFENIQIGKEPQLDCYIVPLEPACKPEAFRLLNQIRMNGFTADMDYLSRNVKSNFKQADRYHSTFILLIGSEEIQNQIITVKNNQTKEEYKIKVEEMIDFLEEYVEEEGHEEI